MKNKSKLTLPLSQIHQKKHFIFSPFQTQFQLPLNKTNKIPTFHLFLPPFCHILTKTTQTKSKEKIYAKKVKRKQRIKETNESSSIENRGNPPYEEKQRLKTSFFPYKYRKNKTNFGKKSLEENLGGGGKIHKPNLK